MSELELKKCTKKKLVELCREKALKVSGTKSVLIDRLLSREKTSPSVKKVTNKKKKLADILQKLASERDKFNIRRNRFDNYEHVDTGLVFNEYYRVIGKQHEDDKCILPLTEQDIEICKTYKFDYEIPHIL